MRSHRRDEEPVHVIAIGVEEPLERRETHTDTT
jgi:hypothetical protein